MNGLKTIVGGLLLHLLLHPAEFTAESILLVGAGFQVIHALIHGLEAVGKSNKSFFLKNHQDLLVYLSSQVPSISLNQTDVRFYLSSAGTLPPIVGSSIMSVLIFIHCLDDPLLILTPILTNTAQAVQAVGAAGVTQDDEEDNGGFTSEDGSSAITLPFNTTMPFAPTCALTSPDLAAPPLNYGKLCHSSNSSDVRQIVFGTRKTSSEMNREERLEAYRHVRQFWCCYGEGAEVKLPEGVLDDIPGREIWEGKSYWKSIDNCSDLPGSQKPRPTPSRLTVGL